MSVCPDPYVLSVCLTANAYSIFIALKINHLLKEHLKHKFHLTWWSPQEGWDETGSSLVCTTETTVVAIMTSPQITHLVTC